MNPTEGIANNDIIVSTIVPLYKGGKYVEHLVEMCKIAYCNAGILDKAELILVNDYPEQVIQNRSYKCVRIINNEQNVGIHHSRVNGLRIAKGRWIHFLDQDDSIQGDFYRILLDESRSYDVVVANAIIKDCGYDRLLYRNVIEREIAKHGLFYVELDNRIISPGQCLIRRSKVPKAWSKQFMKINGADDLLLWLLMLEDNRKFKIITKPLYIHEYTGNNLSSDSANMTKSMNELTEIYRNLSVKKKYLTALNKKMRFMNGDKSSFDSKVKNVLLSLRRAVIRLSRAKHMHGEEIDE